MTYQRSRGTPIHLFQGRMVKDRICFNGAINHHNCTSRGNPGPEFFVAEKVGPELENSLFAGIMGLGVDPDSKFISLIEYLKFYDLVDTPLVSIHLDDFQGRVSLGSYDGNFVMHGDEPTWA